MQVTELELPGLRLVQPEVYTDPRGAFSEMFHARRYTDLGMDANFVQDNISRSRRGVLRGLHFQHPHGQTKLVQVIEGEVFDVVVDVRVGSPTFARWVGVELSSENGRQLYVPKGLAHGFCALSDTVVFVYKCSDYYAPSAEATLSWQDPDIGVQWPVPSPAMSDKDAAGKPLSAFSPGELPVFESG